MYTYILNAKRVASGNKAILQRINIISSPLQLSEAFAIENDIMQNLKCPITTMEILIETEENITKLQTAIENRNEFVTKLPNYSWGKKAQRALSLSQIETTINRWNDKQHQLIKDKNNTTRILRNAIKPLSPTNITEHKEK
jgi:hypothetical protein